MHSLIPSTICIEGSHFKIFFALLIFAQVALISSGFSGRLFIMAFLPVIFSIISITSSKETG